ncbi:hypothetical protein [Spiroplasma endosymbiont of Dilophus febrilis]|uniref:hypothetical protein n=1 Tax=Spiroplasma endosymbiont of Dilophus febrilis TaxID=3066292 RepID=UPI00313E39DD
MIERIKIKIESSSYASIWIRDEWEDDYFGSTYVYFRVNPNLQECSSSESSYNSSNGSEKDEL